MQLCSRFDIYSLIEIKQSGPILSELSATVLYSAAICCICNNAVYT